MNDLITRYVAVWNEPDAELRRKAIAELWTEDGVQILQPPQEIREPAEALGLTPVLEARGHTALENRVVRAYDQFVAPGEYTFRARPNADRLHNVIKFNWEMVPTSGGTPAAVGLEIFILAAAESFCLLAFRRIPQARIAGRLLLPTPTEGQAKRRPGSTFPPERIET